MSRFKLLYFVILIINLQKTNAQISDKRLCVDEECKVPTSLAKTLLRYSSPDSRILSFGPNADITIYSKSAGSREDLWGGEINGKRGYVPKHLVRETKILQKPTVLVDTEFSNDTETKQVPSQVEPDKVQEPYEVVDGTTIYLSPQDTINPTTTESSVQPTALPAVQNTEADSPPKAPTKENIEGGEEDLETKTDAVSDADEDDEEDEEPAEEEEGEDEDEETEAEEESVEEVDNKIDDNINSESLKEAQTVKDSSIDIVETATENVKTDAETQAPQEAIPEEQLLPIQPAMQEIKETSSPPPETVESKEQVQITTLSPELEVPQPLVDDFLPVTPNPQEAGTEDIQKSQDEVPTLPPLGLFGGLGADTNVKTDEESKGATVTATEGDSGIETVQSSVESEETKVDEAPKSAEVPNSVAEGATKVESKDLGAETTRPDLSEETTQPSVKEEITQPSVGEESTQPSIGEESTQPPISEESTQPPVSEESTQPLVSEESTQPPVSEESTQPSVSEEVTRGYVNEETIQTFVSQETTQAFVSEEITQSSVSEDAAQIPANEEAAEVSSSEEIASSEEVSSDANAEESNAGYLHSEEEVEGPGFFARIMSFFSSGSTEETVENAELASDPIQSVEEKHIVDDDLLSTNNKDTSSCDAMSCPQKSSEETDFFHSSVMDWSNFNSDVFLYLVTTAISVIIFLFGYIAFDKSKREGPLVARINKLEKELLILVKENQILQEKVVTDSGYENNGVSNEVLENLKQDLLELNTIKIALEEQVQSLEKELENSTEVGMELNRMLSEILSSEGGSDVLKANVEHLQRQLVEQQATINSVNETLAITNTENHELRLELELSNKKVLDLQSELDKLLLNILKIEEEKEAQQSTLEAEIANSRRKYEEVNTKLKSREEEYAAELKQLKGRLNETERKLELKTNEHDALVGHLKQLKSAKNDAETIKRIIDVGDMKAEMQVLKSENRKFAEEIQREREGKMGAEKRAQVADEENRSLRERYEEADKVRVEAQTKLEVLSNYFKDREAQWQKEISKHEALWAEKEGEATSTTERIRFMQEQLQNSKIQTESLKQEIMSQEIELKSQISVLEKKAHENWVSARQAERKLEESKQEAAQLRHRLTLRERALQDDKTQHRLQSPLEQNGDMPLPLESPASPPLLYGSRDHITKSPPLSGLPPFLPPPPGVPFMPPPMHGVPPFIPPPPPNMFPGDHRPPPLGRMSSPPLNSRYSPSSRGYSPYDRNSSSPSDSEYGTSPPPRRAYSPFSGRMEDRRDREYKRPPPGRSNGRSLMKGGSSGSGHSNESLEKVSRQQSKV